MTTKVATFPLRLPVSLKTALETIGDRADRKAFRRILNRQGGEPPSPEDAWDHSDPV